MGRPALPSFAELAGMAVTAIGFVILVPSYGYIAALSRHFDGCIYHKLCCNDMAVEQSSRNTNF